MKAKLTLLLAILLTISTQAQVGINTDNPDPSSALDIQASDKGILIPRIELNADLTESLPVENPATGLLIYNSGLNHENGFYFWNGSEWTNITSKGSIVNVSSSSIDNSIPRFVGTDGDSIQSSGITIDIANNIAGVNNLVIGDTISAAHLKLTNGASNGYVLISDGNGNANWVDDADINPVSLLEDSLAVTSNLSSMNFKGMVDITDHGDGNSTVEVSPKILQVYNNSPVDINKTSAVSIPFDGEDFIDSGVYTHSNVIDNSRIEIEQHGIYEISYNINSDKDGTNSKANVRTRIRKNGTDYLARGTAYSYARNSGNDMLTNTVSNVMIEMEPDDYIEIMGDRVGDNCTVNTIAGESYISIKLIKVL